MKICLVGCGSFVFGPSVLHDALLEHRLPDLDLALVDPNIEMAQLMAGLGRQMSKSVGGKARLTAHAHWSQALAGADFVICAAAAQLHRRFATDVEIIRRHSPGHVVTEFGGVQGISYSLRQIGLIASLAADMRRLCPRAWLLCSSNPLPRVCQAARELGIPTAGFCSNSMGGYGLVGRLMLGAEESFPWPVATTKFQMTAAGVNHFTFVLKLTNLSGGADVLGEFLAKARAAGALEPRTGELAARTGCWPPNGDAHMCDFLPPDGRHAGLHAASHGTAEERQARLAELRLAAAGQGGWDGLLAHRAWEKPVDLVAAMAGGRPARFHSLNLVNRGQIPNLPQGVFVETPASADAAGPVADPTPLPEAVARVSEPVARLTHLIVRAALERRRDLVHAAVEADPTIQDKAGGIAAMDDCLAAHADLVGIF